MTYSGTAYIGCAGPETYNGEAKRSILNIMRRPGDSDVQFFEGTKGYEIRQLHVDKFLKSTYDFLLLLDHDQIYQPDALERLRAHGLPYVSGLYMRRTIHPMAPVWFKPAYGLWPPEPFVEVPERGRLHPLGASGWGFILIHREVITKTREILKGEQDIIEDAMTVWPYDPWKVFNAIHNLERIADRPLTRGLEPYLKKYVDQLVAELRPLRGTKDPIGSDIRYPFYALQAGYQLMGDPDARAKHVLDYGLSVEDFEGAPPQFHSDLQQGQVDMVARMRKTWLRDVTALEGA